MAYKKLTEEKWKETIETTLHIHHDTGNYAMQQLGELKDQIQLIKEILLDITEEMKTIRLNKTVIDSINKKINNL